MKKFTVIIMALSLTACAGDEENGKAVFEPERSGKGAWKRMRTKSWTD